MIGNTISHYKILEKLGEGGMGVVYKAKDTKLDRLVALKFLPSHLTDDEEALNRLLKEAKSASKINHTNVCIIYDIKEYEDTQYIVMEYIEGKTLKDKIKIALLSVTETIEYSIQICNALKSAHDKSIIHRDIKSENIMINTDNVIKVMDFGLARIKDEARITKASTTAGTIAYMAPEQIKGEDIDHRVDIWALGVVLFEMLTGKFPFKGEYEAAISYSIVNTEPEPMKGVPAELELTVYKALSKNPDERYQNAGDILKDLKKLSKELESKISEDEEEKPKPSIAVLPFADMSPHKDQEYFCDGMSEEIINALTHIENLKVIARTSAFMFKGKHEDMREIGKKLDVEHLLEGSVRKAGNRLRITAQLIKVSDGSHLWSEKYDRELEDVFEIQDEISLAIVDTMKIKLFDEEKELVLKRYTENVEAHALYLKAFYHLNKMTDEEFAKGIEYLKQSIEIDPEYALAYAGISMYYSSRLGLYGIIPPDKAYEKAKFYAEKALELDDNLAEAQTAMANVKFFFEWKWDEADNGYKKALEINPGSEPVLMEYVVFMAWMGREDDSIEGAKKMLKIDPLSLVANGMLAWTYEVSAQFNKAISYWKNLLELNPGFYIAHPHLANCYALIKMFPEALEECEVSAKFLSKSNDPVYSAWIAFTYLLVGEKDKADKIIKFLKKLSKQRYVDPFLFAVIYAGMKDNDQTFEWLDKSYDNRSLHMAHLKSLSNFWFINQRTDPRYKALLKKMGLD